MQKHKLGYFKLRTELSHDKQPNAILLSALVRDHSMISKGLHAAHSFTVHLQNHEERKSLGLDGSVSVESGQLDLVPPPKRFWSDMGHMFFPLFTSGRAYFAQVVDVFRSVHL